MNDKIKERYMQEKIRRNRMTNFWLMLFTLIGTIALIAVNIYLYMNRTISGRLIGFTIVCFGAFIWSTIAFVRGSNVINQIKAIRLASYIARPTLGKFRTSYRVKQ